MTNFMVQYLKGSVEDGTAKTPEYFRKAVADYKGSHGLRTRRGPKRKIIRLDNLGEIDASQLAQIDPQQLEDFLALAKSVSANQQAANVSPVVNESTEVAASS
jgi:hypothetical protein